MAKRLKLDARAFGAEPGMPDVPALTAWIAENRGRAADLTTVRLGQSLAPQLRAGVRFPCAGGKFYADRILSAVSGITDRKATGELHIDPQAIIEDAAGIVIQKKGAWCALPAPHALGVKDEYFNDPFEWNDALCRAYRTIMRTMRDTGIDGHVLVCDTIDREELAALAWQKAFFFEPRTDRTSLAALLERQQQVAVRKEDLLMLLGLLDEYEVSRICILDPDPQAIGLARAHFDPDQILAGGYCTDGDEDYWKDLVLAAECTV